MRSIIQNEKRCFISGYTHRLEEHNIIFDRERRQLSEKYGLKVWLRNDYHRFSEYAVHNNRKTDLYLKKIAQKKFEEVYPELDFVETFGRNYLEQ